VPACCQHAAGNWSTHSSASIRLAYPFTVSGQAQGPVLSSPMAQEDFQRELADLRDKADRYRFVPQLTIGVGYRF